MNTTRNTVLIVLLFAAAAFLAGYIWRGPEDDVELASSPTPSPSPTSQISTAPKPFRSPRLFVVTYTASGVSPKTLAIHAGDTVEFRNTSTTDVWPASDPHSAHTQCAGFDARRALHRGEKYALTFPTATTCTYHSDVSPAASALQGTIIIQ